MLLDQTICLRVGRFTLFTRFGIVSLFAISHFNSSIIKLFVVLFFNDLVSWGGPWLMNTYIFFVKMTPTDP